MISENEQLKAGVDSLRVELSEKTVACEILAAENETLIVAKAAQDQRVIDLNLSNEARIAEINALVSSVAVKDATIAELQQSRNSGSQSGEVYRLTQELRKANQAVNLNADLADEMQAKAEAAALQVESLQNPLAQGSTFNCMLDVMNAAASATKSGPNYTWNHVECEEVVRTMVEGMVAVSAGAKRTKTVNDMVVQVVMFFGLFGDLILIECICR